MGGKKIVRKASFTFFVVLQNVLSVYRSIHRRPKLDQKVPVYGCVRTDHVQVRKFHVALASDLSPLCHKVTLTRKLRLEQFVHFDAHLCAVAAQWQENNKKPLPIHHHHEGIVFCVDTCSFHSCCLRQWLRHRSFQGRCFCHKVRSVRNMAFIFRESSRPR